MPLQQLCPLPGTHVPAFTLAKDPSRPGSKVSSEAGGVEWGGGRAPFTVHSQVTWNPWTTSYSNSQACASLSPEGPVLVS